MQPYGNRQDWGGNCGNRAFRRSPVVRLQHCLGHFLHEQRNAVGPFDDVMANAGRQRLIADDHVDHGVDFSPRQRTNGARAYMSLSDPERLEFRTVSHDQQHTNGSYPVHRSTERFEARGVGPVRILEDHQHWTLLS
jgi:hypothetical protein